MNARCYSDHVRSIAFAVATALVAAVIMWVVTTAIASLATVWQWLLIGGTGVIAFGASWVLGRRSMSDSGLGIAVGRRVRSGRDVDIENISINETPPADVNVGTDVKSKGHTRIRGIVIGKKPEPK